MSIFDTLEDLFFPEDELAIRQRPSHEPGGFLDTSTQEVPAEGREDVNADQTTTVSTNSSVTSTVTASSEEVWELRAFEFEFQANSGDGRTMEVTIQTEQEGVELGFAQIVLQNSDDSLLYRSGSWEVNAASGTSTTRDDILRGHRVDDTNGIEIIVAETGGSNSIPENRTIRLSFEVIKA